MALQQAYLGLNDIEPFENLSNGKNGKEIVHEFKIKKTCTSFKVLKSGGREETY